MTDLYCGSCLCGVVRYAVDELLPQVAHCHCSMCRKFHGAAYATIAGVPRAGFRWVEGEDALKTYTAQNGTTRTFCSHCGSSLTFSSPRASEEVIELALGTVDGDIPIKVNAHIFVGSGANWAVLGDDLPHYEYGRGSARLDR